jgi:hypothetical protein
LAPGAVSTTFTSPVAVETLAIFLIISVILTPYTSNNYAAKIGKTKGTKRVCINLTVIFNSVSKKIKAPKS